jgi:hypothetical protein
VVVLPQSGGTSNTTHTITEQRHLRNHLHHLHLPALQSRRVVEGVVMKKKMLMMKMLLMMRIMIYLFPSPSFQAPHGILDYY